MSFVHPLIMEEKDMLNLVLSMSEEDLMAKYKSVSREKNPQIKSFWKRILDAKKTGSDQAIFERILNDSSSLIGRIYSDIKPANDPLSKYLPENQGSLATGARDNRNPIGRYLPDNQKTIGSQPLSGIGEIPELEDIEQEATQVVASQQAARQAGTGSTPNKGKVNRTNEFIVKDPIRESGQIHDIIKGLSPDIQGIVSKGFNINPAELDGKDDYLQKRENLVNFMGKFQDSLGMLVPVLDQMQAIRDERAANRFVDESIRRTPAPPSVRGENRILSNLIRESEVARMNPARFTQPYVDQVNTGYQQDLARSREYSGGQAGTMVGLSQGAALRRDAGSRGAAGMAAEIYGQGIGRTAELTGRQMQDDIWRDQQNIDIFRQRDNRNMQEQQAAGMGLAMTRQRGIQARNSFFDQLLDSPVFDVDSYSGFIRKQLRD